MRSLCCVYCMGKQTCGSSSALFSFVTSLFTLGKRGEAFAVTRSYFIFLRTKASVNIGSHLCQSKLARAKWSSIQGIRWLFCSNTLAVYWNVGLAGIHAPSRQRRCYHESFVSSSSSWQTLPCSLFPEAQAPFRYAPPSTFLKILVVLLLIPYSEWDQVKLLAEGKPVFPELGILRPSIPAALSAADKRPGMDTALDYSSFMPDPFQEMAGSLTTLWEPATSWRVNSIRPPSSLSGGIF